MMAPEPLVLVVTRCQRINDATYVWLQPQRPCKTGKPLGVPDLNSEEVAPGVLAILEARVLSGWTPTILRFDACAYAPKCTGSVVGDFAFAAPGLETTRDLGELMVWARAHA
jgi:hypothetical protein